MTVQETTTTQGSTTEPWNALVGMILARRSQPGSGGFRSDLRRGIHAHSEFWALPHVAPYVTSPQQRTPLLRAAAITAEHLRAPQTTDARSRLGHAFRDLYKRRNGGSDPRGEMNSISRRVMILPMLPLEEAAQSIDALVAFCAAERLPVNYYDLTRVLLHWGKGLSQASIQARRAVINDFYTTTHEL
jgi:CRISPR type I-E-associated protein CasB/Cse2